MLAVGALELFNEPKDSAAVTLRDLTHDAKRLAPFDVAQPPQAGVGGRGVGGVRGSDGCRGAALPRVPSGAGNRRLIAGR